MLLIFLSIFLKSVPYGLTTPVQGVVAQEDDF